MSEGTIRAAGGVVWRTAADADGPAAIEVAVIHRQRYDDWSLPKGKLAAGEREVDGAIREVLEETGYHVRLGRSLGETRYLKVDSGVARQKVVRWWAMEAAAGAFGPTREVDQLRWLTLGEAHDALTRDQDREVLDRFVRGSATGRMVLLVRNGSATSRSEWPGEDRERPLDDCGWEQADELVRLLAHFDPTDIRAADVLRCRQTVQPLASSLGMQVTEEPLLSEDGFAHDASATATLLRTAGDAHGCVVLASQGDVIPSLVTRLSDEDDVDLAEPPVARKASVWALELQGDRLVSAEYFPPPDVSECSQPAV
ncbi:MAG TPA: NUDIX hydrolase [Candidatus Limnocylindria bacterium]|nr:NUDIX hydrolase [Candidatus Limnocylindria bacterium]